MAIENLESSEPPRSVDEALRNLRLIIGDLEKARALPPRGDSADQDDDPARAPARAEELMDWLRADVSARFFGQEAASFVQLEPLSPPGAPASIPPVSHAIHGMPEVARKDAYALGELMGFHEEAFLRNAYLAVLRREPSQAELHDWLPRLHSGTTSRQEVVGALRYSPEGKQAGVPISGLRAAMFVRRLRRIPGLWRLVGIAQYVLQLPVIVRNLELLDATVHRTNWNLERGLAQLASGVRHFETLHQQEAAALRTYLGEVADRLAALRRSELVVRTWSGAFGEQLVSLRKESERRQVEVYQQPSRSEVAGLAQSLVQAISAIQDSLSRLERTKAGVDLIEQFNAEKARGMQALRESLALVEAHSAALEGVEDIARKTLQRIDALEAVQAESAAGLEAKISGLGGALAGLDGKFAGLDGKFAGLDGKFAGLDGKFARLDGKIAEMDGSWSAVGGAVSEVSSRSREHAERLDDLRGEMGRALGEIEAGKAATASLQKLLAKSIEGLEGARGRENHALDSFYVEFENRFRGERDDIKSRMSVYIPHVQEVSKALDKASVLDIGCGRGEWLEVLRDQGIEAHGVDTNIEMVRQCRAFRLKVRKADGLQYLRKQPSDSVAVITGIHIIEHIPFDELMALFAESLRVLRSGGITIFETPNPENMIVGSCNFWYDPTHLKPLPPEMLRFLLLARGFARADILRLHPFPAHQQLPEGPDAALTARLNELLYGPQDFSVIAHKA